MTALSAFDMFKIGVGPSSSHTMGPWVAAQRFLQELRATDDHAMSRLQIELFGSLAKTGKGHGTDIAVQLGLSGHDPKTIDVAGIDEYIRAIADSGLLKMSDGSLISFNSANDIVFHFDQELAFHPNGIRFTAIANEATQLQETYYSIGGGFVVKETESQPLSATDVPFPIETAADLLGHCATQSLNICEVVKQNELAWLTAAQIESQMMAIQQAMIDSVHRGCQTEGVLPGGLNVQRRAARTTTKLLGQPCPENQSEWLAAIQKPNLDFQRVLDWVSCFALATNEENAAFGRVVTAPTNGSAGVIPAVLLYFQCFCKADQKACLNFLFTAAEIGCIFKKGSTISAALGGCQAEIGVSSAMAAAALTEGLGGTPAQAAEAAEIAMEHHLGMTCDPIGGLVQIPCIERNAMGAIKAITAAQMSLQRDPKEARVTLDAVVNTMWKTAQDMNAKYKETSEGGLAVQIPVNLSEC